MTRSSSKKRNRHARRWQKEDDERGAIESKNQKEDGDQNNEIIAEGQTRPAPQTHTRSWRPSQGGRNERTTPKVADGNGACTLLSKSAATSLPLLFTVEYRAPHARRSTISGPPQTIDTGTPPRKNAHFRQGLVSRPLRIAMHDRPWPSLGLAGSRSEANRDSPPARSPARRIRLTIHHHHERWASGQALCPCHHLHLRPSSPRHLPSLGRHQTWQHY